MYDIGQSPVMWEIRTHPNMLTLQAGLNGGGTYLICSFDGVNYGQSGSKYHLRTTFRPWPHLDQNINRLGGFETYQCGVVLNDNFGPNEGGFICYPEAWGVDWKTVYSDAPPGTKDWFKFPVERCHPSLHPSK